MSTLANIIFPPFAQYNAEEEIEALKEFYFEQQNYHEIIEMSKIGVSRFILGQRGQGKSAMIYHLLDDLEKSNLLAVLITRYDGFPEKKNEAYFLYSIIQKITFALAKIFYAEPDKLKLLNDTQKNEVGVLIQAFYDQKLADEFLEKSKKIRQIRRVNWWKRLWNKIGVGVANTTLSTVTQITAQLIQSYTGTTPNFSISEGEYFHGVPLDEIGQKTREDIVSWPLERLVKIVKNLIVTSQTIGFGSIVVLFDKIDEVKSVNSEVDKVADFVVDFLTDIEFLQTQGLSIVISLWSEVKHKLNTKNVRFDKFKEIDIRWKDEELVDLLNKRLKYYSKDKSRPVSFESLIPDTHHQSAILNLVDGSPRSLLTLMSYIESEEHNSDPIVEFSPKAISEGCMTFCKKFDYVSLQPSRTGKGNDLKMWINKLLRMRLSSFSAKQYNDFFTDVNSKQIIRHFDTMLKLNLIRDSQFPSADGKPIYEVVDPRIIHMIGRGVLEIE